MMALVGDLSDTTAKQTLNKAFDHRSAVATRTGEMNLIECTFPVQTRLIKNPKYLLLAWAGVDWLDCAWNAHRKNPLRVQGLAQRVIIEGQIASQRVDGRLELARQPADDVLSAFNQRSHIATITGVASWQMPREDKTRDHVGTNTGLFTKLHRTVTLALHNGRNRRIVFIDDFAMQKLLAVYQAARLVFDTLMVFRGLLELARQALALAPSQIKPLLQDVFGGFGHGTGDQSTA